MTPRPAPAAALLGLAAVCALVAGCASGPAGSADAAAPRLAGSIQQYREDEVNGVLQVALTNDGPSPVVIERIEVDWPGFAEPPAADPAYRLAPGLTADLPLASGGRGLLSRRQPPGAGPRTTPAVARVQVAGGEVIRLPLPAVGRPGAHLHDRLPPPAHRGPGGPGVRPGVGAHRRGLRRGAHGRPGGHPPRRGRRGRRGVRRRQRAARPGPGRRARPGRRLAARRAGRRPAPGRGPLDPALRRPLPRREQEDVRLRRGGRRRRRARTGRTP